jgi:signal transduction histidine kinase
VGGYRRHGSTSGSLWRRDLPVEPVWVAADEGAIEQLVLNLLLNAAEAAAREGRAGIAVDLDEASAGVRVWDTGDGIPPEEIERIFEPFFSTRREGTGLGLPIARRIARAHGSDLSVESRAGEGAAFIFQLPREGHQPLPPSTRRGNAP